MASLKLNDPGTRQVLHRYDLKATHRIGRGQFCAVFDDGPQSVLKLTSDPIQMESVRDYLSGEHFPLLTENIGYVGEQLAGEMSLMLYRSERLKPLREADRPTKRLARKVITAVDQHWHSSTAVNKSNVRGPLSRSMAIRSQVVVEQLTEDATLPSSLREAFVDLQRMMWDYDDLSLDFKGNNLMVRNGNELVLNDVVMNSRLLCQ